MVWRERGAFVPEHLSFEANALAESKTFCNLSWGLSSFGLLAKTNQLHSSGRTKALRLLLGGPSLPSPLPIKEQLKSLKLPKDFPPGKKEEMK